MGYVLPPILYRGSPNFSKRDARPSLIVLHDTEGSYSGAVSWLCDKRAEASAHLVLSEDGMEATQLVAWGDKAWHCVAFNGQSIGIEMAGQASKGFSNDQLHVAARIVAFFLNKYDLPARHVKPQGTLIGRGWTLHQDLGAAGGGHHDPGFSTAKTLWFSRLVSQELKRGGFRPRWGIT